jgi:hypothetical protein
MGGRGSGGHNLKGRLRDVQCARLDVHELAREGKLKLGSLGLLFGAISFEVAGGPDAQRLMLEFPCRSESETLEPLRQLITCYWRQAHYGGRYLVFLCSECHHSARVLCSKGQARSAQSPSVEAMPQQICGPWRMAASLMNTPYLPLSGRAPREIFVSKNLSEFG